MTDRFPRIVLLSVVLACLASPASADLQQQVEETTYETLPGGMETVTFKVVSGQELKMDVLLPTRKLDAPAPAYVMIHGGGWNGGDRIISGKASIGVFLLLAEQGFVGFSIDYRLVDESTKIPALVEDCKDALRFIHREHERFNIDPDRIAVWGGSAGAHLAMMVGLTGPDDFPGDPALSGQPATVRCIVDWYGPSDMAHDTGVPLRSREREIETFGVPFEEDKELFRRFSPANYLKADSPPLLCIHGENDSVVPIGHSRILFDKGQDIGARVSLVTVLNGGHGKKLGDNHPVPSLMTISQITADYIVYNTRAD